MWFLSTHIRKFLDFHSGAAEVPILLGYDTVPQLRRKKASPTLLHGAQPSSEANSFTASQEISHILWNRKFVTTFTTAFLLSLSCARLIHSTLPTPFPTFYGM